MKEVLIYGALVATILGASVPVIQNLQSQTNSLASEIQTGIQTQFDTVKNLVNSSGNSSSD